MIGEKLIAARTEKNLTQEQLAEKLYVTRQAVSRWENDKTQPDLQTLGRICSVLCVTPEYFIEVDKEEINYKTLSRARKKELYYAFAKKNRRIIVLICLFSFFLNLTNCGLVSVSTLGILDNIYNTFGVDPLLWVYISIGIILFAALNLSIVIYINSVLSRLFNEWLAQRGVARTKKFLLAV